MDLQRHKWKTAGTYDVIIRLVCWVDLAQQLSHHTATQLPCPTPEDKGDNRKRKSKKTGGLLERQFNKWRKDKKKPAASSSWRISKEALNVNTVRDNEMNKNHSYQTGWQLLFPQWHKLLRLYWLSQSKDPSTPTGLFSDFTPTTPVPETLELGGQTMCS